MLTERKSNNMNECKVLGAETAKGKNGSFSSIFVTSLKYIFSTVTVVTQLFSKLQLEVTMN